MPTPSPVEPPPSLLHFSIPVGMLQCNCSIIGDPLSREALVLDPGDEIHRIMDQLGRYKLSVKAIVSTHAHIDHVGGLKKLHDYTGAPVLMHRDDVPLYQAMDMQAAFLGIEPPPLTEVHQFLREGDTLQWGNLHAQVIHTPGHTPGSSCLYLPPDAGKVTAPICGEAPWKKLWIHWCTNFSRFPTTLWSIPATDSPPPSAPSAKTIRSFADKWLE
jgi:glyoxylase-like metal-dependent hydrolase (beta-lactamase superfamily II)